jgi:2-polyprenyl-3-methyl-5-hydroxy-6-metoxy-1,4-benzoquinol methylase
MRYLAGYPIVSALIEKQLALWPEHQKYIETSLADRSDAVLGVSEQIATFVMRLAEHSPKRLDGFCADYRYLCEEVVLPEEVHFRRNGSYRLSAFADAYREWYSNDEKMSRYMTGLLVSNILWSSHARAVEHYVNNYLASLPTDADHLEIGPGHGLLLYFAARRPRLRNVAGWDISPTSIAQTRDALNAIDVPRPVSLERQDLFDRNADANGTFDSVVLSEILEHLEDPLAALRSVREILRPGGRVWINVPVNSPAPDHIYLLRSPEEACQLAENAGFAILDRAFFPVTGATLERARKYELSITCVITAQR